MLLLTDSFVASTMMGSVFLRKAVNIISCSYKHVQEGISEFVREYLALAGDFWERPISREFADEMCSLVYPNRSVTSDSITENFNYDDRFDSEASDNLWKQII